MANKWAIANGNWSDGSTWNDGVVPTAADNVYANGKTVQINTECFASLITNTMCPDTSTSGGKFQCTLSASFKSITINSSILASNSDNCVTITVPSGVAGCSITINGEYLEGNTSKYALAHNLGNNNANYVNVVINANINDLGYYISGTGYSDILINGNVSNTQNQSIYFTSSYCNSTIVINGNITQNSNSSVVFNSTSGRTSPTLTINGNVKNEQFCYIASGYGFRNGCVTLLNGNIQLSKALLLFPPLSGYNFYVKISKESTIMVLDEDDDDLVFSPISSPNLNYPTENNVKNGIKYGYFNDKEGNYTPNFPQESTVLKDVEYGGNKVGTLEVIALSGATAQAENISVVNLTEKQLQRVGNCATVSTVQKCFEEFNEE